MTLTYQDHRKAFRTVAAAKNFTLNSFELPGVAGPAGEILACDLALRKSGATTALITTSGVHGVEGSAGSALQCALLELSDALPGLDLFHLHSLNPYGFAWDRRTDHDNIDINRNFISDWAGTADLNPGYDRYADIIVPRTRARLMNELRIVALQISPGAAAMKDIITQGQYTKPLGMYYGGQAASWSRTILEDVLTRHLSGYDRIVHLDIHTGLGAYGSLQLITADASHPEAAIAKRIWGPQLAFLSDGGLNTSVSSPLTGILDNTWTMQDLPGVTFTMEFGTYAPLRMFRALQADHSAYARGETDPVVLKSVRRGLRAAFIPDDPAWLAKILKNGTEAYQQLARTLAAANKP